MGAGLYTVTITNPDTKDLQLDRFGRKTRTTNLPNNSKNYDYILADIPNQMYEYPKLHKWIDTVPSQLNGDSLLQDANNLRKWQNNAEEFFNQLLNVDYRTIGSEATWAQEMKAHRNSFGELGDMKEYAAWVKKNQIVTEGVLQAEPSIILHSKQISYYYMRSHFKFKILSGKQNKNIFYDANYDYYSSNHPLKYNVWYEGYIDMPISTNVMYGDMYYVSGNAEVFNKNLSVISKLKD